jgi:hypothetical protein
MRYKNFLKIAALTIPLIAPIELNHSEKVNHIGKPSIEQKINTKSNKYNNSLEQNHIVVSSAPSKKTESSILKKTFKVVAFTALGFTALGAAGMLYFIIGITIQGKMTGGMTRKEAYKELGHEFLEILGKKRKYTKHQQLPDNLYLKDINKKPQNSNRSKENKPYRRTKF